MRAFHSAPLFTFCCCCGCSAATATLSDKHVCCNSAICLFVCLFWLFGSSEVMDTAKQHWEILQRLGTDLANRVREFLVIGYGEGVIVATKDGLGFWFGKMQFGSEDTRTATKPTSLDVPGHLVRMGHGHNHILLLNRQGEIYSMGMNYHGQLGLGTVDDKTHFSSQLISSPQKFSSIRCGYDHSVALTDDGKVWAWGLNKYGQVGVPSSTSVTLPSPRQISKLDPHRIVAIECGGFHSLALTDQGEVYGWGATEEGQLGIGSETSTHIPTRIPSPSPVQSMAAGSTHTLLLTQTGEVWACGENHCCQLGLPSQTVSSSLYLSKVAGLPSISQIEADPRTNLSIAMTSDKRCFAWGQLDFEKEEEMDFSKFTPLELPALYSTVESALFFSLNCATPHSVSISETPPSRLSEGLSRMFDNPEESDVQFVVEQRTIHAHRIFLKNFSDYFARMFSERWMAPVDLEDPIVRVTIPDHSYPVFYAFLRFLYTDCLEVYPNFLPELFELASMYLVSDLQQLCLTRMRTTITPTTCCLYYPLTHRHSLLPELATFQQELVQFASTRMSAISATAVYQSMETDLRDNLTNAAVNFTGI